MAFLPHKLVSQARAARLLWRRPCPFVNRGQWVRVCILDCSAITKARGRSKVAPGLCGAVNLFVIIISYEKFNALVTWAASGKDIPLLGYHFSCLLLLPLSHPPLSIWLPVAQSSHSFLQKPRISTYHYLLYINAATVEIRGSSNLGLYKYRGKDSSFLQSEQTRSTKGERRTETT